LKKEFQKAGLRDCVEEIENKIKRIENDKKTVQMRF